MSANARRCDRCGGDSKVVDTRDVGKLTIRRRRCLNPKCSQAWDTSEGRAVLEWTRK